MSDEQQQPEPTEDERPKRYRKAIEEGQKALENGDHAQVNYWQRIADANAPDVDPLKSNFDELYNAIPMPPKDVDKELDQSGLRQDFPPTEKPNSPESPDDPKE